MLNIFLYLLHVKYSVCSLVRIRCRKLAWMWLIVVCMTKTIYNQPIFDMSVYYVTFYV